MSPFSVYLWDSAAEELVEGFLYNEINDLHLELWNTSWAPEMKRFRSSRMMNNPEDSHWDWKAKMDHWKNLLGYQSFALVCKNSLQGLMMINDMTSARLSDQFGSPLVYVEFIATAPWNRPELGAPPKYRGVGRVMMLAAIEASKHAGYKGRVGLHSLPGAERFYEEKCGFTRLGIDSGHEELCYFEMTQTQADSFCHNRT